MDPFEEYIYRLAKVNIIVEKANSAKEILEEINSSTELDLERDFEQICSSIKTQKNELLLDFLAELGKNNNTDLIIDKLEYIGLNTFLEFSNISKEPKFTEFVYSNFERLINTPDETQKIDLDSAKEIIVKGKNREEIQKSIKTLVKKIDIYSRVALIEIINDNPELGNIEDYLEDLLCTDADEKNPYIDDILSELVQIDNLDMKKKLLEVIKNNAYSVLDNFDKLSTYRLELFLVELKEIELEIPSESQKLIDDTNIAILNNLGEVLRKHNYDINLIKILREFDKDNSKFLEIQNDIINNLSLGNLVRYIDDARGKEGFDKNWDSQELVRQLFKNDECLMNDEIFQKMISRIIQEICEHENKKATDIEFAGQGYYSFNIKIGDYILKVGDRRGTRKIPNDKRIIKPLIRQEVDIGNDLDKVFIEVQNAVDANWYKDLSKDEIREQLYNIYSELRNRKIIWTDIKPENVGRLLKPNKENFKVDGYELKSSNSAVSFTGKEPDKILQPGELVIIDTDYIFRNNKKKEKIRIPKQSYYKEFEKRYREEKKKHLLHVNDIKEIIKKGTYTNENVNKTYQEINYIITSKNEEKGVNK